MITHIMALQQFKKIELKDPDDSGDGRQFQSVYDSVIILKNE